MEMKHAAGLGCIALALTAVPAHTVFGQTPAPNKPGFPLTITGGLKPAFSKPVVADLGLSGGVKSIIYGATDGRLHVIYRNSSLVWEEAPGFPKQVIAPPCGGVTTCISGSPAVGRLGNATTGPLGIVVPYGDHGSHGPGGVRAYLANGTPLWDHPTEGDRVEGADGKPDPVEGTPAIGDINGDGLNEVVWGATDYDVYAVRSDNGANLPGWPKFMRDTVRSSPALHDIDGDGKPEIIIGVDAHAEAAPFNSPDGGCLHVMRFDAAQTCTSNPNPFLACGPIAEVPGFPVCVDQAIASPPSVGDIDGDGRPEIVHGTDTFYPNRSEKIYAWKCDGTPVPGWPVSIQGQSLFSPALANLDGDAALEVVVSANNTLSSNTFHVYGFKGNGTRIFETVPVTNTGAAPLGISDPVIADVLNNPNTESEILVGSPPSVAILSNTGALLSDNGTHGGRLTLVTNTDFSGVTVADFGDGRPLGVVVVAAASNASTSTQIFVWEPIARTSAAPPWGGFRQNAARVGVAPGSPACKGYGVCAADPVARRFNTVTPCRLVDTRLSSGVPYGQPALSSEAFRDFLARGFCGVPAGARALSVNITVVSPQGSGFVRFSPGCQMPPTSNVNFGPGQTRANNTVLALDSTGLLTANAHLDTGGTVQLLIDVNGYFQ
jgi:hypothetical protein